MKAGSAVYYSIIKFSEIGSQSLPDLCPMNVTASNSMKDGVLTSTVTIFDVSVDFLFSYDTDDEKFILSDFVCADDPAMELDTPKGIEQDPSTLVTLEGQLMGSRFTACLILPDAYAET